MTDEETAREIVDTFMELCLTTSGPLDEQWLRGAIARGFSATRAQATEAERERCVTAVFNADEPHYTDEFWEKAVGNKPRLFIVGYAYGRGVNDVREAAIAAIREPDHG